MHVKALGRVQLQFFASVGTTGGQGIVLVLVLVLVLVATYSDILIYT